MRQLRLVGLAEDGASLLLETPTGDSFRLPLDERVRAACRGDLTRLGQIEIEMDNPLRPREIQMRIRAGESAEQVAASSGMPLDRVLRFAYAVMQERGRVVAQARGTAARPKSADSLSDLVEDRLISRGTDAATLQWDAWRRDDGRWAVKLAWRHGDREHAAHWSLDLARRQLQPEDPAAEQLVSADYHARTITAVTPLAVAARVAEPSRPSSPAAEPGRAPERTPARAPERTRPTDSGRAAERVRPTELGRTPEPASADEPEPRRVVERRPGEPSRRARRSEAAAPEPATGALPPAGGARPSAGGARPSAGDARPPADEPRGPNFDEIRAGGRRPGSDRRADPGPQPHDPGRRTDPAAQLRDAQTASGRRADPAGQMRDSRVRPGSAREPSGGRAARSQTDAAPSDDPPAEELRQVAAGGGTIPLVEVESEDDRARRATVPSWDDILLGVRRQH
jgi:Protein of unknown function (DUF3071)